MDFARCTFGLSRSRVEQVPGPLLRGGGEVEGSSMSDDFPGQKPWRDVPSDAETLAWVRNRELIRDLPQRYAHGIDTDDWEKVASVFHPECLVQGTLQAATLATCL